MAADLDAIVVGGGIIGLATARRLLIDRPGLRVTVFEKEQRIAAHQTGHNSGVIHSGVYYAPGSLKARLCREGKLALESYADEHEIPYHRRGKLIVALDDSELGRLDELERRARQNGVEGLAVVDRDGILEIEPHARGIRALHAPGTGVIDYTEVATALARDIVDAGGSVVTGTRVTSAEPGGTVVASDGRHRARVVVACCGLQSDRMAGGRDAVGAAIVPFRGDYYTLRLRAAQLVNGLVYPVPDPAFPFLGVHFTRHVDGSVAAGPNAVLALAREGYRRTSFSAADTFATLTYKGFWRLVRDNARTGAAELWRDLSRRAFVRDMQRYIPEVRANDVDFGPSGIRAQAVTPNGKLVDDFLIATHDRVVHVVNAPSPGATSSLAIAGHIAEKIERFLS